MDKYEHSSFENQNTTCFKKWSRKGYAVFSSIGVVVHIGNLSVSLLQWVSQVIGQNKLDVSFYQDRESDELECLCEQDELLLVPVVAASEGECCLLLNENINCRQ